MVLSRFRIDENGRHVFYTFAEGQSFNPDVWLEDKGQFTDDFINRTVFEVGFRKERDAVLALVDIDINKAEDLGEDTKVLRKYRQDLRDATKTWIMPTKG